MNSWRDDVGPVYEVRDEGQDLVLVDVGPLFNAARGQAIPEEAASGGARGGGPVTDARPGE